VKVGKFNSKNRYPNFLEILDLGNIDYHQF
jgi:hypothetical protein